MLLILFPHPMSRRIIYLIAIVFRVDREPLTQRMFTNRVVDVFAVVEREATSFMVRNQMLPYCGKSRDE